MNKYVELTGCRGAKIFINTDKVTAVTPADNGYDVIPDKTYVYIGGGDDDCFQVKGTVEEVLKKIGGQVEKRDWTPCSVDLPKNDGKYIVTIESVKGRCVCESWFFSTYKSHWTANCDSNGNRAKVVAWKNKPTPWEGGTE